MNLLFSPAAYLLTGFYRSFSIDVRELGQAVARAASGDLTLLAPSAGKDEIAQLRNAFGQMGASLAHLVTEVRGGTDTIAVASREIAVGNADLSICTEEQASSLQETAALMDQLAATVKRNADSTQQNAAMGEQAAAASESMQGQVMLLSQAVSAFKLDTHAPGLEVQQAPAPVLHDNAGPEPARLRPRSAAWAFTAPGMPGYARRCPA